nr:Mariner Mos1 transposase [Hymenolepis microstoma]
MVKRLAVSGRTCRREYFQRFKSGGDFAVEDRHSGGGGKVVEDGCRIGGERFLVKTRVQLKKNYQNHWVGIRQQAISKHLRPLGIIEKERYLAPHLELKPRRDVDRRLFVCEQLLLESQMRKGFLHRIVTGYEKWVYYNNPKGAQTIMEIARWSYCYVNTSADEYPWLKSHALRLVGGPAWRNLL